MDKAPPETRNSVIPTLITPIERAEGGGSITVHAVVSTTNVARDGGIVEAWNLDNYELNSVVLFQHDPKQVIGRASNLRVTSAGLEADIEFMDEATNVQANTYGKMVRDGWLNAFSVRFTIISERKPTQDERSRGCKWVGRGELLEISLVGIPMDPGAVVTNRTQKFTKREVETLKSQFSAVAGWEPILRSLEATLEPAPVVVPVEVQVVAPPVVERALVDDLITEANDLMNRLTEILVELTQEEAPQDAVQDVPRSIKIPLVVEDVQEVPAAPAVEVVRESASAPSLDMHKILDALRKGKNSNG